jgi:cytochrome c oxidase cbb3-type subunit 1
VNSFAETVAALHPMFALRAFGGCLPRRRLIMVWNVWATILGSA